jgi:ubiquitin carboxyl-terminal hydrolase 4/11/15
MLTFVLDGLHEDLNRVKSKPYLQLTEKLSTETDEEAAKRWWDVHIKRENSIIVDLFHGQYKSTITCPECKMISLTYDPFMHLGVPIPSPIGSASIKIKYFLIDSTEYKLIETDISDSTLIGDVKKKIQENEKNLSHFVPVCVSIKDDLSFKKVLNDNDSLLKFYKRRYEVVFYEIHENIEELEVFMFISPAFLVKSTQYLIFNKWNYRAFFYPRPFFFTRKSTIRDLYIQVFKCFLPFFNDHSLKGFKLQKTKQRLKDEIDLFFNKKQKFPFSLLFKNNRKTVRPWYFPFKEKCEFCGKNCEYCELEYKEDKKLTDFTNKLRSERELLLFCVIKTEETINNSDFFENLRDLDLLNLSETVVSTKESVNNVFTLNDCLESFRKEERLEKENSWYCPTCKKHQEAFKKMEIYRSPKVLIIQIKRFKLKETNSFFSSSYQNKKNDCFIDYPVNTLDLGPFISGAKKDGNIYELFAISQHYGSLSSGHYTALCKNRGKWYSFDDESVSRADEKQVVNKAAYLLFYRRIDE